MALEKKITRFYPSLALRILFYLRSVHHSHNFVYPQELINHFQTSKSFLSQKVKILKKHALIRTENDKNSARSASHLKIFITKRGLKMVVEILSEGLNPNEINIFKRRRLKT
ncbi:MAG: hypothetical protein ACXADU_15745 [Promethearchaeota archaeon]|jgi:DNA-binding MarR family transcriptional regulator